MVVYTKLTGFQSIGAVRNADRIWVSTPQNRTIGVNLGKELVCSRAIHSASYIERKEAL